MGTQQSILDNSFAHFDQAISNTLTNLQQMPLGIEQGQDRAASIHDSLLGLSIFISQVQSIRDEARASQYHQIALKCNILIRHTKIALDDFHQRTASRPFNSCVFF